MNTIRTLAAATGKALSVILPLTLAVALTACGGAGETATPDATTNSPPMAEPAYSLAVDARPLAASTRIDAARATTADVGPEGATLETTGADGTRYRLQISADALTEPATITMTPLTAITGLPFGEAQRGVQLEPDGLQFRTPVRLDIVAPAGGAWPLAQQIAIGMQGAAQHVTLASVDRSAATPGLLLMHFSSYAIVLSQRGLDASLSGVRQRLGGDAEQRLQAAVGEVLQAERQAQLQGLAQPARPGALEALMRQYHREVLAPRLAAAAGSCAASKVAINTLLGLERSRQLMGMPVYDPTLPAPDFNALLLGGSVVCMREEFQICRDEHIITRIIPKALGIMRTLLLAGVDDDQLPPEIEAYTEKCLRFDLQMEATVERTRSQEAGWYHGFRASERVDSRMPIRFEGLSSLNSELGLFLRGAPAPLVSRSFSVDLLDGCDRLQSTQRIGGTAVGFLKWTVRSGDVVQRAQVADFRVAVAPLYAGPGLAAAGSNFTSTTRERDSDGSCSAETSAGGEYPGFASVGLGLLITLPGGSGITIFEDSGITGWTMGAAGSARLATKDIEHTQRETFPTTTDRLRMSLVLNHTPAEQ